MKKIILPVLILIAAAVWFISGDSAEEQVRQRLQEFSREVEKPLEMPPGVTRIAQVRSLRHFFSKDVVISAYDGRFAVASRSELIKRAQAAYNYLQSFSVSFSDLTVTISEDEKSATVHLTALARGVGGDWNQAQELKMSLIRDGGDWIIAEVEAIEALSLD